MRKFIQNKLKEQKGLTLIELLAVIVILAIIAAIAIPAIGNIIDNSRVGAAKADVLNAVAASELYLADNPNEDTVTLENLLGTETSVIGETSTTTDVGSSYIDDVGTLDSFTYDAETKTADAVAITNKYTITFADTTKADVSQMPNNNREDFTGNDAGTIKFAEITE